MVEESQMVHPSPGNKRPSPAHSIFPDLAGSKRPTNSTPFTSGQLVAQAGLFMNPPSSSPRPALSASRLAQVPVSWEGETFPPSSSSFYCRCRLRAGSFSRPVEPVGGHSLFWI